MSLQQDQQKLSENGAVSSQSTVLTKADGCCMSFCRKLCTKSAKLQYDYLTVAIIMTLFVVFSTACLILSLPHSSYKDVIAKVEYPNADNKAIYEARVNFSEFQIDKLSGDVYLYYVLTNYIQSSVQNCMAYRTIKDIKSVEDIKKYPCKFVKMFFNDSLTYQIYDKDNKVAKKLLGVENKSVLEYDSEVIGASFPERARLLRWIEISVGANAIKLLGSLPAKELVNYDNTHYLKISGVHSTEWVDLIHNTKKRDHKLYFRFIQQNKWNKFTNKHYYLILSSGCLGCACLGLIFVAIHYLYTRMSQM